MCLFFNISEKLKICRGLKKSDQNYDVICFFFVFEYHSFGLQMMNLNDKLALVVC